MDENAGSAGRPASYANGRRRRQELVEAAAQVFAHKGFQRMSLRRAAEELGTSHTLLRHHFGSLQELLADVLALREQEENPWRSEIMERDGLLRGVVEVMRHNETIPGSVQLDAMIAGEALQPEHPAHGYIKERGRRFHEAVVADLRREQEAGRIRADLDVDVVALQLAALVEGIQVKWLYDDSIDMAAVLESYVELLRPHE